MKRCIWVLLAAVAVLETTAQVKVEEMRNGDLIFFVNPQGNAITKATTSLDEYPTDHVAIFYWSDDKTAQVIEAVHRGVCITSLDTLLEQVHEFTSPTMLVGRVNEPFDVSSTLRYAFQHLGKPYDFTFAPDDEKIYCSELVQKSYVNTQGEHIFGTTPMSFSDQSGKILPYWQEYYEWRGLKVPEGEPGTNPGGLARDQHVSILGFIVK